MRCPRRPAPHRPPRLIAPAGCPPTAAASGACQSAAVARWPGLAGSQLSGSCGTARREREGWGRGGAPGEGSLGADFRSRENPPEDPWKSSTGGSGLSPGETRSPGRPQRGGSLPGGAGRRATRSALVAPRDPGLQSRRRGFPGAGGARPPASHAVTAGDVSASPGAEATRGGAGFWASRELCPLSCSKQPNQKANLQASTPNVTLSAGRGRAARNGEPRVVLLARRWGEFSDSFATSGVEVKPAPR